MNPIEAASAACDKTTLCHLRGTETEAVMSELLYLAKLVMFDIHFGDGRAKWARIKRVRMCAAVLEERFLAEAIGDAVDDYNKPTS